MFTALLLLALTVPNWGWKFPDLIPFRSKETKMFNGGSKPEVEEPPLLFVREFIDPQYDSSKQVDAIGPYDKVVEMVFTTDSHSGFQQTGGNKMHEHGHRKDESGQHHCRNVLHTDYNNSTDKARNQTLTELIAINAKDGTYTKKYFCICYKHLVLAFVLSIVAGLPIILFTLFLIVAKRNGIHFKNGQRKGYQQIEQC